MILNDAALRAMFPQATHVGPSSVDLHLGGELLVWPYWVPRDPHTDQSDLWKPFDLTALDDNTHAWILKPGNRYLGTTRERVVVPPTHCAQVAARSSWGRDGLSVICGPAGFIDAGFGGQITLELGVLGSTLLLRPGDRVAQLVVMTLTAPAERPYQGRYQQQHGPTPSRSHLDGAS